MKTRPTYLNQAAALALILFVSSFPSFAEESNTLTPAEVAAGWKLLFNGKDLTEWKDSSGQWSVENGAITARATAEKPAKNEQHLIWQGGEFSDFELTYKAKILPTADAKVSTCYFSFRNKPISPGDASVFGPQQIVSREPHGGHLRESSSRLPGSRGYFYLDWGKQVTLLDSDDPTKPTPKMQVTGTTGDTADLESLFKLDDWNNYRVIALGKHIQSFLNGKEVCGLVDQTTNAQKSGVFALQLAQGARLVVQFRDIKVREIKPGSGENTSPTATSTPRPTPAVAVASRVPVAASSQAPTPVPVAPSRPNPLTGAGAPVAIRPAATPFNPSTFAQNRPSTSSLPSAGAKPASDFSPTDENDLEHRLVGTTWVWEESKTSMRTLKFAIGGEAFRSDFERRYTWKVTADKKAIEGVTIEGRKFRMTFDATLTRGKIFEAGLRARDTKIVQ
jgi:hypothetical protein